MTLVKLLENDSLNNDYTDQHKHLLSSLTSSQTLTILKRIIGHAPLVSFESPIGPITISSLPSKRPTSPHGYIIELQENDSASTWLEFTAKGQLAFAQWEQRFPERFVGTVSDEKVNTILHVIENFSN
jgi:hypothetical protein